MSSLSTSYNKSVIPKYKLGQDLFAYKHEDYCKICNLKIKDSHLSIKTKRYNCKFCHHAVCENCSNLRCMHTSKGGVQRICIGCFNEALEEKCVEEYKSEKDRMLGLIKSEREANKSAVKKLKKRIVEAKNKISRRKDDLDEYNKRISELNEWQYIDNNVSFEILVDTRERHSRRVNRHDNLKNKILSNEYILNTLQAEAVKNEIDQSNLQAEFASFDVRRISLKIKDDKSLEILKNQLITHNGVVSTLKHDIETLQTRILEASKGNDDCMIQ
ncbi:hypothetical protein SteCoe_748 [Stentor coeruleus]|uniref:FYVE-type domain-containing protein n=1 Tax=Stentor coeruleus TaxID=5963 RepID=A0A1R2D3K8_9CILI|nr:hypothetical protein SteCoe_748 [Stentor coeruleus]